MILDAFAQSGIEYWPNIRGNAVYCCSRCFKHGWLKRFVREHSYHSGKCEYCGARKAQLIEVSLLADPFHNLLSMYVPAENFEQGDLLINHIQWNWEVFADELSDHEQYTLLNDIANSDWDDDDGDQRIDANELYMRKSDRIFHTTHRETWERFCDDVRRDASAPIPFDEFLPEELGEAEELLLAGTVCSRARPGFKLGDDDRKLPWSGLDIGAPVPENGVSPENIKPQRANVAGEVFLYAADEERTALAEIRPPLGSYVTLGTLELERACRVMDLTAELPTINPFTRGNLDWFVEVRSLLRGFAGEMAKPLEHNDDQRTYLPCQKLAAFIRDNRYDGIRYPSALSPGGSSIVFFDPRVARATSSKLVHIIEVRFEYKDANEHDWG